MIPDCPRGLCIPEENAEIFRTEFNPPSQLPCEVGNSSWGLSKSEQLQGKPDAGRGPERSTGEDAALPAGTEDVLQLDLAAKSRNGFTAGRPVLQTGYRRKLVSPRF